MDYASLGGWIDHPDRHAVAATMPRVADFPHLFAAAPTGDILLFKAWKDVLGAYPNYPAQQIGDCESFGNSHAHDLLQCIEASLSGSDLDYRETCTEAAYAAGREAGNMLGNQDGCYGSAMVKGMTEIGLIPREAMANFGGVAYSGQRAKQFGRTGLSAELKKIAAQFKLGGAALVKTWDELRAALSSGYPVAVSSNRGFQPFRRDSRGICRAGGGWDHCMFYAGIIDSDGVETALQCQSWGNDQPGGPIVFDMPLFAFRTERADVEYQLRQGDSFALSKTPGFAHRALPSGWSSERMI